MKQQNESVKKLEVGKDYIRKDGLIVIDRIGVLGSKGFDGNDFEYNLFCLSPYSWREATKSEVIEAFKKHLIHRYGKDWKTMEIKENHPSSTRFINNKSYKVEITKKYDGWNVWNENGLLYCNGIWVERLEEVEEPKIHIKEAIKENAVIHCETEEEAERILVIAHELGYKWTYGEYYIGNTQWIFGKSKTCYRLIDGTLCNYNYFKNRNYTIIPSTQIADVEEKKSDKKRYKVIKTSFSDFKQVSLGDNKTNRIIAHFVEQDEETVLLAEKIVDILNLMEK